MLLHPASVSKQIEFMCHTRERDPSKERSVSRGCKWSPNSWWLDSRICSHLFAQVQGEKRIGFACLQGCPPAEGSEVAPTLSWNYFPNADEAKPDRRTARESTLQRTAPPRKANAAEGKESYHGPHTSSTKKTRPLSGNPRNHTSANTLPP